MKNKEKLISIVVLACLCMGFVDGVMQPGYWVKSLIKAALFLGLPLLYTLFDKSFYIPDLFRPNKKGLCFAAVCGICIYLLIVAAFLLFRNFFDFSALTSSLTATTGVNKSNFVFVALYISFCNSLLEEFFFRGFCFFTLKKLSSRNTAYLFSATMFALYHIAMMIGWFGLPVILLALAGLFVGGTIFNYFNEKYNIIYPSWIIHMFANFATNTIGIILFNK